MGHKLTKTLQLWTGVFIAVIILEDKHILTSIENHVASFSKTFVFDHVLTFQVMPQGNKSRNYVISALAINVKSVMALYQKIHVIFVWKVS